MPKKFAGFPPKKIIQQTDSEKSLAFKTPMRNIDPRFMGVALTPRLRDVLIQLSEMQIGHIPRLRLQLSDLMWKLCGVWDGGT